MYNLSDLFKDKKGRIVICQLPNLPLIGWFTFTILRLLISNSQPKIQNLFLMLSFGFIFTWSWLEIISGVNYFRRALGLSVLIITISSYSI